MKKGLLITIDYPPNTGGVARYLETYAKENNLDVLAPKTIGHPVANSMVNSRVIRHTLIWGLWPKWLPLLFWGWFYGRKYDYIVISHILPVGYLSYILKKSYTIILHGLDIINAGKISKKKYFAKNILENANKIIVNSKATGNLLYTIFGCVYDYKVCYPKAHKMTEPTFNFRKKYNLDNKKIILSLGRLVKRKGQEKILRIMPKILCQVPEVFFIIAGVGSYKGELEYLVNDLQLRQYVKFLGKVPEEDLPNIYNACDVFVLTALPSNDNWEGFGMVCLEANQFNKPVVVSNVGGLPEAAEQCETGYVVSTDKELEDILVNILKEV